MNKINQLRLGTFLSFICLAIPLSIYGLWIYIFNFETIQTERVTRFKSYFPDFLDRR